MKTNYRRIMKLRKPIGKPTRVVDPNTVYKRSSKKKEDEELIKQSLEEIGNEDDSESNYIESF